MQHKLAHKRLRAAAAPAAGTCSDSRSGARQPFTRGVRVSEYCSSCRRRGIGRCRAAQTGMGLFPTWDRQVPWAPALMHGNFPALSALRSTEHMCLSFLAALQPSHQPPATPGWPSLCVCTSACQCPGFSPFANRAATKHRRAGCSICVAVEQAPGLPESSHRGLTGPCAAGTPLHPPAAAGAAAAAPPRTPRPPPAAAPEPGAGPRLPPQPRCTNTMRKPLRTTACTQRGASLRAGRQAGRWAGEQAGRWASRQASRPSQAGGRAGVRRGCQPLTPAGHLFARQNSRIFPGTQERSATRGWLPPAAPRTHGPRSTHLKQPVFQAAPPPAWVQAKVTPSSAMGSAVQAPAPVLPLAQPAAAAHHSRARVTLSTATSRKAPTAVSCWSRRASQPASASRARLAANSQKARAVGAQAAAASATRRRRRQMALGGSRSTCRRVSEFGFGAPGVGRTFALAWEKYLPVPPLRLHLHSLLPARTSRP